MSIPAVANEVTLWLHMHELIPDTALLNLVNVLHTSTSQHSPTLFNTLQHSSTLSNTFQMIPQPIHLQSWIHLPSIHYPSFIIFQNEEFSSFCTSLHHQVCHSAASHTAASHTADISLIYLDPGRPNRPPFEGVAGFRIRKEHMSDSSTAMTAPALSNSPQ